MWLEDPESMRKTWDFENTAFSAWNLSWYLVLSLESIFFEPSRREILCYSMSLDICSMVFFIHRLFGWFPLLSYEHLALSNLVCLSLLEYEAPSEGVFFSLGLISLFFFSFPPCFPFYYTFLVSLTKRAWFLEVLRSPIYIILSCSWIRDFVKESSDGICQFGFVNLPEWKVDTNTDNFGPCFPRIESTNCSFFLSIPHCLHIITKDLNLVKNY